MALCSLPLTVSLFHCSTVKLLKTAHHTHIPNENSIEKNKGALAQEQGATCKEQRLRHAALTMRFTQNTQHDTSKVLRLPCDMMMMMVSKVLHLPRKMQLIFRKRRQSIAPATLNDFRHVIKQVGMSPRCHACHAKRSHAPFGTYKSDPFRRTRHRHGHSDLARTVADACDRKRNIERTHPQPPDPQSETGTLPTHSGNTEPHYGEVGHLRGRAALNIFESP